MKKSEEPGDLTELMKLWRELYDAFLDVMKEGNSEQKKIVYESFGYMQTKVVERLREMLGEEDIDIQALGKAFEQLEGEEAEPFQEAKKQLLNIKKEMDALFEKAQSEKLKTRSRRG